MSVKIKKGTAIASLTLTPLIDIVFLLLIFFLVATRFAKEDRMMDVLLPTASEAQPMVVKPKEIFINIDEKGNYHLGRRQVDLAELEKALLAAAVNNPGSQSAVIRADKRCPWDFVAQAINVCNKTGVEHRVNTSGDIGAN